MYCPICGKDVEVRDSGCRLLCVNCNAWL